MFHYFAIHKPYKMLSQFKPLRKKKCLGDIPFSFPVGCNAVGRLDENTEGLLLITNNTSVHHQLLKPVQQHNRVYWVQVQGVVAKESLTILQNGITIRLHGNDYITKPCQVKIIDAPSIISPRTRHPVSTVIPSTWLELILTEGKFHQVRKMTAAIDHQTLRLFRVAIERIELGDLLPNEVREINEADFFEKLNLNRL